MGKRTYALGLVALAAGCAPTEEQERDGPEPLGEAVWAATVAEAAASSCSTLSVKGLSEQIVAQSNCIAPGAFVLVPELPNVSFGQTVFPYLEEPARDAFVEAVNSKPGTTLGINSMLRTVAQQYLLYNWYQSGSCGIGLAATPGNSNHETGLAFDTSDYNAWKSTLQANGFSWYGNGDPVHYDYVGPGAVDYKGTDVLAFQQLWNDNHPEDPIGEDGAYGPQTEDRLEKSPAEGFAMTPTCGPAAAPDIHPSSSAIDAADDLGDGASAGRIDVRAGDTFEIALVIENKGMEVSSNVDVGVEIDDAYLAATDYVIETDFGHAGTFEPSEANDEAANPPHDEDLPTAFSLDMNGMSPGEKKRVRITLRAEGYSVAKDDEPAIRFWVADVPMHYHQDGWDEDPSTNDGTQTFGPKLQDELGVDVYSRTQWQWNGDRREGWEAGEGGSVEAKPDEHALLVESSAISPGLDVDAGDHPSLDLRVRRVAGASDARVLFSTADADFDPSRSWTFAVPDDGAFHDVHLDLRAEAGWTGTVTGLSLDLGADGASDVDFASLDGPIVPGGEVPPAAAPEADAGCACRAGRPTPASRRHAAWLVLLGGALLLTRSRGRFGRAWRHRSTSS